MSETEIVERAPESPVSVLAIIQQAATNPLVDVEKMERLMAMQERIHARESEALFNEAMTAAQSQMGRISADCTNNQTSSKYASYAKLDRVLRPIYIKHGFSLSFGEADCPKPDYVRVTCDVSHRAGHVRHYFRDMPADGKGAKGGDVMTKTHASGAAQTYGMRYLLKGIFNVAIGEEDNDGNDPGLPVSMIDKKQLADLKALIEECNTNLPKLLKYWKITSLDAIPADAFDNCCRDIRAAAARRAARGA